MFHQKIDAAAAIHSSNATIVTATPRAEFHRPARFYAVVIVFALPLILVWLLARFVWNDVKGVGRAIGIFYRGAAEELSRF